MDTDQEVVQAMPETWGTMGPLVAVAPTPDISFPSVKTCDSTFSSTATQEGKKIRILQLSQLPL